MAMTIQSNAFKEGELIPQKYTCDGQDISPPLSWHDAPKNTAAFALIFDDPDAPMGTWDHWILYNVPPNITEFLENVRTLPAGTLEGLNSWAKRGYGGPCPPDKIHRYYFKLYALDALLSLPPGASKKELETTMQPHVLAEAVLMGRYDRVTR
jgi:Raf kinase inhibitor-like YbhB/YbcL family protein